MQAFSLVNLAFGVNTQYVWSTVSWGALRDLDCFEDQPGGGLPRPSILLLRALGDYLPDGFSPAILCLLLPLLSATQPVLSKSDLIRPANRCTRVITALSEHKWKRCLDYPTRCMLRLLLFPWIIHSLLPAFYRLLNGEAGCSPHRPAFIFPA